jgi:hypothetical protein
LVVPTKGLRRKKPKIIITGCASQSINEKHRDFSPASMSRPGHPHDNASCESFMKTLKREEIHANAYRDLEHLAQDIEVFIDHYYNRCRLHSALGYRSPEEFEEQSKNGNGKTAVPTAIIGASKS